MIHNHGMDDFKILMDEMKLRGYSKKTICFYAHLNKRFLMYAKKSPREVTRKDIESYLVSIYDWGRASATRHLYCSALKFYYETVLKRKFNIPYPKKSNKLPVVLSRDEIGSMINSLKNQKHRMLLELLYGSGLRLGEAIKIKAEDICIQQKTLFIHSGKGDKDRIANLSGIFIDEFLGSGIKSGYLFESAQHPESHIHPRTAQSIVKCALQKAGIIKKAHCHTLRTSYATHLIENGVDISYVQKLLGHARISTTQAYIRLGDSSLRAIKSPLDQ